MEVRANRDKLNWMLTSYADSLKYHSDKSHGEVANLFLDNEISMEDGMDEYYKAVVEVQRRNKRLLRAIRRTRGYTFYKRLLEVIEHGERSAWK